MLNFLKLIRPINLLIIGLTMYSVQLFFVVCEQDLNISTGVLGNPFDYFLLVISTIMIAAAGNIINDYFDLRADRINKPNKVIIGKYIKKRWAIVWHWTLNFTAFAIAIYLSLRYNSFWYLFIHLLSINALWFYSMSLKRKFLVGNLVVAGLTALVPILCGVHFYIQNQLPSFTEFNFETNLENWEMKLSNNGIYILLLAFFAFFSNLVREILKDVQDVAGDKNLRAKTIPIAIGEKNAIRIGAMLLAICPIFYVVICLLNHFYGVLSYSPLITLPVDLAMLLQIFIMFILLFRAEKVKIETSQKLLKLSMFLGLLLPVYWYFL